MELSGKVETPDVVCLHFRQSIHKLAQLLGDYSIRPSFRSRPLLHSHSLHHSLAFSRTGCIVTSDVDRVMIPELIMRYIVGVIQGP